MSLAPPPDSPSSSSNNSSSTSASESPPPPSLSSPTLAASTPPPSSPPPPSKPSDDGHSPPPPLRLPPPSLPPPPHNHHLTPSDPDHSTDHSHKRQDINLTVTICIVAGVGVCFLLMIILCVLCSKRKKKPQNPMQYYADGSAKYKDGGIRSSGKEQNQRNGQQNMEHIVNVSPWQPPATMMGNSGASSSSGNSGPHVPPLPPPSPIIALGFNKSNFSYEELAAATNNFSPANLLGQGGFGYVHKGVLPNGNGIAVKKLKAESGQGEREFQAEVDIISRVHHRHLVSLVGYCIAGSQRLLVYEFVPNSTLEYHLHG